MLLADFFSLFNFHRNSKPPSIQLVGVAFKLRKRIQKNVMCSRSPQNLEFGHCMLLFCRGWQRNVPKFLKCLCRSSDRMFLLIKPIALCHCHCCHHCSCSLTLPWKYSMISPPAASDNSTQSASHCIRASGSISVVSRPLEWQT